MSEETPLFARDYQISALHSRIGYYASVLKTNMTRAEFRTAIIKLQTTPNFVGSSFSTENGGEIDYFYDNFEIVASSSEGITVTVH